MNYTRLTKEQFEELHQELINFLATQSITADEWLKIKNTQPEVAEQELDVFSDLIWDGALTRATYLQNRSPQQLFLFKLEETQMKLIVVKTTANEDISSAEGLVWLQANIKSDEVELFTATKAYSKEKNMDVFQLIQQGAEITEGMLFETFSALLS